MFESVQTNNPSIAIAVDYERRIHQTIITRENGDRVRLLATDVSTPFSLTPQIDVDTFVETNDGKWALQSRQPKHQGKSLKAHGMSVQDYIDHGRPPAYYAASIGEHLKAAQEAKRAFGYH